MAVAACCSQSSPSGSQWPRRGPLSCSLDGRSVSLASESCTQRCLCQLLLRLSVKMLLNPQMRKKEAKKKPISLYFHCHSIIYVSTSFSPFHTVLECSGNRSRRIAGIRPASETADFNLYLNPSGPRVQTQTKLLGLCKEKSEIKIVFSPWGSPLGRFI